MGYKEDLQRVHAKIDNVIQRMDNAPAKTAPNQWQIASATFAGVALIVTVLVSVFTHQSVDIKNAVRMEVSDQLKEPLKQSGAMAGDIAEIKGKLEVLDPLIRDMLTKKFRESKNLTPRELKAMAEVAKTAKLQVDPQDVRVVGRQLLDEGKNNPDAWSAAQDFLNYRSFLNVNLAPRLTEQKPYQYVAKTQIEVPQNVNGQQTYAAQTVSAAGTAPPEQSARMEQIDGLEHPPSGAQFIIFEMNRPDFSFVLDGMHLKNVIVKNVHVKYYGTGPVILENVYFVNCTFELPPNPKTRELGDAILASAATTFRQAA
ncbi:MAG TPA: hypothetical protein VI685_19655 [Candidatus Angelobacter sp.]